MIGLGLILISSVLQQMESSSIAGYGRKCKGGGMFFNAIICLFAAVYFVISDTDGLHFAKEIWGYGLVNSGMYALGFYTIYMALKMGPYGITMLATSFVVVVTSFCGIVFLKEPSSIFTYISLILIVLSLILTKSKNEDNSENNKLSFKWGIYIVLTTIANASIAMINRLQFNAFGNVYKNEFSVISLLGATLGLFILGICLERGTFKSTFKNGFVYGAAAGILNGAKNLCNLVAYNYMSLSVWAPLSAGIGLVMGFVVAVLIYKEKFTFRQILGVVLGIVAVVLMNIKF